MAELFLLASVIAMGINGVYTRRNEQLGFDANFNPYSQQWDPVNMPRVQPYRGEPHDVVWDDINDGVPLPQSNRSILMNRPLIWVAKAAVEQEPPKVQRDPLYPDDLRAYDTSRSRGQRTLHDAQKKNYQFGSYHIPHLAQNKTRQEVAQSQGLAGRFHNQYTSGSTSKNGALFNAKDPSAQVVRQRADHIDSDRSTYQVWTKKQYPELTGVAIQDPEPTRAAIHHPTAWIAPTKVRSMPRYLNAANNQHGWSNLQARDNRGEIADIDTMKKKKLILFSDQGTVTSQVTHYGGYGIDGNALAYPETNRRREVMPEVGNGGLFQQGTGRTFLDANTGQDGCGKQSKTRDILVQKMRPIPHVIGENMTEIALSTPWLGTDPTNDHVTVPRGTYDMWKADGQPYYQTDGVHSIEVPLLR